VSSNLKTTRISIVQPLLNESSETFLRAHAERLPADVQVIHYTGGVPQVENQPLQSQARVSQIWRKTCRTVMLRPRTWKLTPGILQGIRRHRSQAVLAEYGPAGVAALDACRIAGIPLIVHFHGYDTSIKKILRKYAAKYRRLFRQAAAVIAVSRPMRERLVGMGADPAKTHLIVYGVDCRMFAGASPAQSDPRFVAVGRFVEKKSPHSTLLAFAEVRRKIPAARLRMIGEGPLLESCKMLAGELELAGCVDFLGARSQEVVSREMQQARAFVQHSVEAPDGDCEGTPVSIIEAGAAGLPVVATRHGGIPDVVEDGRTGFLVDELDVAGMAQRMIQLAENQELAGRMGQAARQRIAANFSMEQSIGCLWSMILSTLPHRHT